MSTVSGVELSSVMISWMGPGGDTVTNDSRVTISQTISTGNHYISTLEFAYLMEGDEGTYICNVAVLEAEGSDFVEIRKLISKLILFRQFIYLPVIYYPFYLVPSTYVLNVNSSHIQIVGQSVTLECILTTVQGITSAVNFVWRTNGAVLKEEEKLNTSYTTESLNAYSSTYTISPLSTADNDRIYQCDILISSSPPVTATGSVTLDVTGMSIFVCKL